MTYSIIGILATILLLIGNRDVLRKQDGSEYSRTRLHYRRFLLGVINDILDISRIESGSMSLKNAEFSFAHELEQVNAIVTAQCHDKKIRYSCNVKDGVSNCYIGDEMKLRQVLINILGNAPCALP